MTDTAPTLFAAAGVDAPAAQPKRRGRKPLPEDKKLTTCAVRLNPEQMSRVRAIGNGNITDGLRRLVENASLEKPGDPTDRLIDAMHANDHLPVGEQFVALMANPDVDAAIDKVRAGKKLPAPVGVDYDGETYDPLRDYNRLKRQMKDVWTVLAADAEVGHWRSIPDIQQRIINLTGHHHSDQGISARLRDLRKPKFGRWDVEKKPSGRRGLWLYRLEPKSYAVRLEQYRASLVKPHPSGAGNAQPLPGFEYLAKGR